MALFEHFPYTNFHDLNLDWIIEKIKNIDNKGTPSGGTTGQVLTKASDDDYDVEWTTPADPEGVLPEGGSSGQILAKKTATDYDAEWVTNHPVPAGGSTGQVLGKSSATDYALTWITPGGSGGDVPAGGTTGQALVKASGTDYDTTWGTINGVPDAGSHITVQEMLRTDGSSWVKSYIGYPTYNRDSLASADIFYPGTNITYTVDTVAIGILSAAMANIGYEERVIWAKPNSLGDSPSLTITVPSGVTLKEINKPSSFANSNVVEISIVILTSTLVGVVYTDWG